MKIPACAALLAFLFAVPALAGDELDPMVVNVQPASAWPITNPPPRDPCPTQGNPLIMKVSNVGTPSGPGIRTDANGIGSSQ